MQGFQQQLLGATTGTVWNYSTRNPCLNENLSPWFSEENGGYSVEGAIFRIQCNDDWCDSKYLKHHSDIVVSDSEWLFGWFSDVEGGAESDCPNHCSLVSQIQSSEGWCDRLRIRCSTEKSGYCAISNSKSKRNTVFFSKERSGFMDFPDGYYLNSIRCCGKRCNNIRLQCVKIEWALYVDACEAIDIPGTYATTYLEQPIYDEQVYPLETKATFVCAYNPYWRHLAEMTCQADTDWDKDPINKCKYDDSGDEKSFRVLPNSFNKCPSFMYLRKQDCKDVGLSVEGILQNSKLHETSLISVQFGWSIDVDDGLAITYNTNHQGVNDGNYEAKNFLPYCQSHLKEVLHHQWMLVREVVQLLTYQFDLN